MAAEREEGRVEGEGDWKVERKRRRRGGGRVMEDGGPPSPERHSALQQLSGTLIWSGNYTHTLAHTHTGTHTYTRTGTHTRAAARQQSLQAETLHE